MPDYSYAQIEQLWINAGGSRALAPLMAAIALAETGGTGNSDAYNAHDSNGRGGTQVSAGLWQISNGTMTPVPGWSDAATNARYAVAKYKSQGLGAWGTYTSGAYKHYLSNKTTPDPNVSSPSGGGSGGKGTQAELTAAQGSAADCAFGVGWTLFNPAGGLGSIIAGAGQAASIIPGFGFLTPAAQAVTGAGQLCILTKSQLRGIAGVGLLVGGGVILGAGLGILVAGSPVGNVVKMIPGTQTVANIGKEAGATGGQAKPKRQPAKQGKPTQAEVGEPKENPDLEVRGGTVRESSGDRAARQRRQQAAARARARRAAASSKEGPASRSEAGF